MAFSTLTKEQRKLLARAVAAARSEAELGAHEALMALAVNHHEPFGHMDAAARKLRNTLRAHGRQLGDARDAQRGTQEIRHLGHEVAFEHWHRMLFARFLAENRFLIHPQFDVALSLDDCKGLAIDESRDPWEFAASLAQDSLPQIFRKDDPALMVALPTNRRSAIEKLVVGLPTEVFTTTDALGWTYQFWQSEAKAAVNARGDVIGADDISAVTQLFTEHYMVEFLLHNTLGAWHAGKVLAQNPQLATTAQSEAELRSAVAIDGCDWKYLRFVRADAGQKGSDGTPIEPVGPWIVAAGTYPSWPLAAKDITVLEPCLGSGHIFVSAFEVLVALRRHEENLSRAVAIHATLKENMFGLELDPRCTQIAAFALALHAWRTLGARCELPRAQIACCGLSVGGTRDAWVKLGADDAQLASGMGALYDLFEQAPLLGSLIDPERMHVANLVSAPFDALVPLLEKAASKAIDEVQHEVGIAAAGMVEAVRLLRRRYTLVITNPPYLGRGKQTEAMKAFADEYEKDAKHDLATMFVSRALRWCGADGTVAMVLPQTWLFLSSYKNLRQRLLKQNSWSVAARLGPGAFQEITGEVVQAALVAISGTHPTDATRFLGIDVSNQRGESPICAAAKAEGLAEGQHKLHRQAKSATVDECRLSLAENSHAQALRDFCSAAQGIATGDYSCFGRCYWELSHRGRDWEWQQGTVDRPTAFGGCEFVVKWEEGNGKLIRSPGARIQGLAARGKLGVAISQTGALFATRFNGTLFDNNCSAVVIERGISERALWWFMREPAYAQAVREIDQQLKVTNGTLVLVGIDIEETEAQAAMAFPCGLPHPQSNDPTQWLFHGHPAGMLAAGGKECSPFSIADFMGVGRHQSLICRTPNIADMLQVAVARIVGYRWPAELETAMKLDVAARDWATRCAALLGHADDDGIVPINPMCGKQSAEVRVRDLLRDAFAQAGMAADQSVVDTLIAATGSTASTLADWLQNDFFDQHCKLFHHRPFVWHIWDGRKDGFNVLVHYHRLAAEGEGGYRLLENLTYNYLKDWIDRQEHGVMRGDAGAEARLAAARVLQQELVKILEGEAPYDIFVRWKTFAEQPLGWMPDINDGVRLNIRPFLQAKAVGKKGAGILRGKPNIKGGKDRGSEPMSLRPKLDYPWFWGCDPEANSAHQTDFMGAEKFTGDRWNDLHFTLAAKRGLRQAAERGTK